MAKSVRRSTIIARAAYFAVAVYGSALISLEWTADSLRVFSVAFSLLAIGGLVVMGVGFGVPYVASMVRHRQLGGDHRAAQPRPPVRLRDWLPLIPCGAVLVAAAVLLVVR
jgi:hypothetical protein